MFFFSKKKKEQEEEERVIKNKIYFTEVNCFFLCYDENIVTVNQTFNLYFIYYHNFFSLMNYSYKNIKNNQTLTP